MYAAEGGASDAVFGEDYRQENLAKSRERQDKAGNYGSNQDLSLSSQSKTLQTQKRRWKASDADSKERKASPVGGPYDNKAGGYGASFQNRDQFTGAAGDFDRQKKESTTSANISKDDKGPSRSNGSSVSPDRSKAPGGPDASKAAEPAQPKKTSLFGGGKKERLNPFVRKPGQQKAADGNQSSGTGTFGVGSGASATGPGLLGGPSPLQEPDDRFNFNNDRPFGQNAKPNDIGNGLGSGFGGLGSKTGAKPDNLNFGDLDADPKPSRAPAAVADAKEPSSGTDYEDDFEVGESIANLGDKGSGKKDQPDQFELDFFAPAKGTGADGKPSEKESDVSGAFDDEYEAYTYKF